MENSQYDDSLPAALHVKNIQFDDLRNYSLAVLDSYLQTNMYNYKMKRNAQLETSKQNNRDRKSVV